MAKCLKERALNFWESNTVARLRSQLFRRRLVTRISKATKNSERFAQIRGRSARIPKQTALLNRNALCLEQQPQHHTMNIRSFRIGLVLSLLISFAVHAQGSCTQNAFGQVVCAPPGGSAQSNSFGQVVCAPGQCVTNSFGQIMCSSQPAGGTAVNNFGQVVCVGGCIQASPSYCKTPR